MNSDLSAVKAGNWICTIEDGWQRVQTIDTGNSYPVHTAHCTYTSKGLRHSNDIAPSAFIDPPDYFNAGPMPSKFVQDQKVYVRDSDTDKWLRRYFSHETNEHGASFECYCNGCDNWSNNSADTRAWAECISEKEYKLNLGE